MKKSTRIQAAQETLAIFEAGRYTAPSGRVVEVRDAQAAAMAGTRLYLPSDFPDPLPLYAKRIGATVIEVTAETTLEAARRLAPSNPMALNFASAKNPGGGFLNGSQAQEESLARSSGLYPCLLHGRPMYDYHRQLGTCLYSDHMIYSPDVPVIREDEGALLDTPYTMSFLTSSAVNAGALYRNEPHNISQIQPTMAERLRKVLWLASEHGHNTLILGAWGCGVFRNDPAMIAGLFAEALGPGAPFDRCFAHVTYAVYDGSENQEVIRAFQTRLS
ncbi:TIGR02452 family protein [Capsulimonas corticalis]|uniref:TIGR02452 family protein n=1 Tax=Capsulimonas corticalis TaxID=2219043 RepID=A0A402D0V1_9BACT|nr:TIGR02452 family protein [Capsulimonas corticalis]BDI33510.1 TIGR02452 family protein [Capsulimonas corticalis]